MRLIKRNGKTLDIKLENNKFISDYKIGQRDTIEFECIQCKEISTRRVSNWPDINNVKEEDFICPDCNRKHKNEIRTKEEYAIIEQKRKETKLKKYNDENYNNKTKRKKTNLERYGYVAPIGNEEIKEKIKQTNLERYGVENAFLLYQPLEIEKRKKESYNIRKNFPNVEIITPYEEYDGVRNTYKYKCRKCGNEFDFYSEIPTVEPRCQFCFPLNSSSYEQQIEDFIKTFAPDLKIKKNDRTIIKPYEIDLLIGNIGFEIDGLFWHNEKNLSLNNKPPSLFHLMKTKSAKEKGVDLFHIFEDEWLYNQEIVKSRIKNILGFCDKKVFARKCKVIEISTEEKNVFLNENHIQGEDKSSIKLGLIHNNELISVMTFAKDKSGSGWDLTRFANKKNYLIVGGASKLLKNFIKKYNPEYVISFSDKRWSNGNLYKTLGFKFERTNPPAYWYVKGDKRIHRFNLRKKNFPEIKHLTENEITKKLGYNRIWDCGYDKWKLDINNRIK